MAEMNRTETMKAAMDAAHDAYRAAVDAFIDPLPTMKCRHCDGQGEAQFCGPDRDYGVCFVCCGRKVVLVPSVRAKADAFIKEAGLVSLRARWVAVRDALRAARADTSLTGWEKDAEIEELTQRLAGIEREGKSRKRAA